MEQMCVCDCVCLEYIYFKINYKLLNIFNGKPSCGKLKKSYLRNAWEIAFLLYFSKHPSNSFGLLKQMMMSVVNLQ